MLGRKEMISCGDPRKEQLTEQDDLYLSVKLPQCSVHPSLLLLLTKRCWLVSASETSEEQSRDENLSPV